MTQKILITGAAGFIGFHLVKQLSKKDFEIIGIDNLNTYYDLSLKNGRLNIINKLDNFKFIKMDLNEKQKIDELFKTERFDIVVNLAAQAGVRYSITNPSAYIDSNIIGFFNILEASRNYPVNHLLYASSSSVYGGNQVIPFSEDHNVDHPVSLYAATKKSNELMAHAYSSLYGIPTTGLRFFTVYGPWGRPDMAYFSFADKIVNNETIDIYNHGEMERDFTYIDDIVKGIERLIPKAPISNSDWNETANSLNTSFSPYRIFNIGNSKPIKLMEFISVLEKKLGKVAKKRYLGMQSGDVVKTYANTSELEKEIEFIPETSIDNGIGEFVEWYKKFYELKF